MLFLWDMQLIRLADGTIKPLYEVRVGDVLFRDAHVGTVVRRNHEGPLFTKYYVVDWNVFHVTWDGDGGVEVMDVAGTDHWTEMNVLAEVHVDPPPTVIALPEVEVIPLAWRDLTALARWKEGE